ncbi:MAG: hypothetical protein Q9208_008749 [Pyrenodesmia sp. 3 TL-2023]
MPPFFDGNSNLDGATGRFLAIWDSCTSAAFAYTGVEIVAMTAAEAKYPKRDFPFAAKCTWLITIGVYVSSVLFVSLCVPWTNSKLLRPGSKYTGAVSPFYIAIDEAGIAVIPGLANAGFLFAAWTAANTQLYVASRTFMKHSIHDRSSPDYPYLSPGQPFTAIFGLVASLLIVFFSGWKVFYQRPFKVEDFLGSYLWVIVFICIYTIHKVVKKSEITSLRDLDYYSFLGAREEPTEAKGKVESPVEGAIYRVYEKRCLKLFTTYDLARSVSGNPTTWRISTSLRVYDLSNYCIKATL